MTQSKPRDLTPEELALIETPVAGVIGAEAVRQSKPRDLTSEELELIRTPPASEGTTAPLRIPPGTQVAIEQLNPIAAVGNTVSPKGGPTADADVTTATGSPALKVPTRKPDSGKRKGK